jgi:hypothetical protein
MRERGERAASADPHDPALALLSAVEGRFLLAQAAQSSRPLEIALDMAIDHVAWHVTARQEPRNQGGGNSCDTAWRFCHAAIAVRVTMVIWVSNSF